ncbi:hypothetical protein FRC17_004685 [Serendipita sp. 399]|nr:hypothetical protein FRC17_004685 [Serendipita sp. 399]
MGDSNFFKGTSTDQDRRFADKESKLLKTLKFPPEFDNKVDMRKIKLEVLKPWINTRFTELNGIEDEIVASMIIGLLEEKDNPTPDPRKIQIQVQGFLTTKAPIFMLELWKLLLDAQSNPHVVGPAAALAGRDLTKARTKMRAMILEIEMATDMMDVGGDEVDLEAVVEVTKEGEGEADFEGEAVTTMDHRGDAIHPIDGIPLDGLEAQEGKEGVDLGLDLPRGGRIVRLLAKAIALPHHIADGIDLAVGIVIGPLVVPERDPVPHPFRLGTIVAVGHPLGLRCRWIGGPRRNEHAGLNPDRERTVGVGAAVEARNLKDVIVVVGKGNPDVPIHPRCPGLAPGPLPGAVNGPSPSRDKSDMDVDKKSAPQQIDLDRLERETKERAKAQRKQVTTNNN